MEYMGSGGMPELFMLPEREYSALEAIDDNYEKIVISLDDIALPSKGGIKHIQAWRLNEVLD